MTASSPTVPARGATNPLAMLGELLERDGWSRERLLAHQREQLDELLRHAVSASSYYREALGPEPWTRPLSELPTLSKTTLMENWGDIVTEPDLDLDEIEQALTDPGYDGIVRPGVRACATSGTTGRRGVFVFSDAEFTVWIPANVRALARIGVSPDTRLCSIGSPSAVHMSRQIFSLISGVPTSVAPPVSVLTPLDELAAYVQEFQPEALIGYPSTMAALAQLQLRGELDISPRIVAVGSEVLSDDAIEHIRAAWGVEPRQAYPTTEVPMIASGIPQDPDLRIAEDLVIVEVVDENGEPVPHGTPGHRVLVTNLVSRLQPLIRYELADAVTTAAPEGLPYTRITRIEGRTSEILELPARGGGTVLTHPHRLRRAFARLPEVSVYQLRISPTRVRALIVPAADAEPDVAAAVERALATELDQAGVSVEVAVEITDRIDRDLRGSGKLQTVVAEKV